MLSQVTSGGNYMKSVLFSFRLVLVLGLVSINAWALHPATPAEDGFFQNVIFFEAESFLKGESVIGDCNATLVSNQFAVTAAHCVADAAVANKFVLHFQVGKYKYIKRKIDGKTIRLGYVPYLDQRLPCEFFFTPKVKSLVDRKSTGSIPPNEDVAVIKFQTPLVLPGDFVFAPILGRQDFENLKKAIPANTLGAVSINLIAEISNLDTKRIALFDHVLWHQGMLGSGWFTSKSTARVDAADSGSPVFVLKDKTYYLAAVVKGLAKTVVSEWDVFAPVAEPLCQIARDHQLNQALFCH